MMRTFTLKNSAHQLLALRQQCSTLLFVHLLRKGLNGFRRVVTGPAFPYFKNVIAMPVAGVGNGLNETFIAQAYEFVTAIAEGRPVHGGGFDDAYVAVLVCEAIARAAEHGTRVRMQEVARQVESGTEEINVTADTIRVSGE